MKRMVQILVVALKMLPCTGCLAVKVSQSGDEEFRQTSQVRRICRSKVVGVEPEVKRVDDFVSIAVNIIGSFDLETRTFFISSPVRDEFIAVGMFPGVMSCSGEYQDSVRNALSVCVYNLIFAGAPTVYGLLFEPFILHYPLQTGSIVGRSAFVKSPLIGVSRYSKFSSGGQKQGVSISKADKVRLEDAIILAPALGLESDCGQTLRIPIAKLPKNGEVGVKLRLPTNHPLKKAMSDYEDAEIIIQCNNK